MILGSEKLLYSKGVEALITRLEVGVARFEGSDVIRRSSGGADCTGRSAGTYACLRGRWTMRHSRSDAMSMDFVCDRDIISSRQSIQCFPAMLRLLCRLLLYKLHIHSSTPGRRHTTNTTHRRHRPKSTTKHRTNTLVPQDTVYSSRLLTEQQKQGLPSRHNKPTPPSIIVICAAERKSSDQNPPIAPPKKLQHGIILSIRIFDHPVFPFCELSSFGFSRFSVSVPEYALYFKNEYDVVKVRNKTSEMRVEDGII